MSPLVSVSTASSSAPAPQPGASSQTLPTLDSSMAPPAFEMIPLPSQVPDPKLGTGETTSPALKSAAPALQPQQMGPPSGEMDMPCTPYLSPTTHLRGTARYRGRWEETTSPERQTALMRALVIPMVMAHPKYRKMGLAVLTHHRVPSTGPCTQEELK